MAEEDDDWDQFPTAQQTVPPEAEAPPQRIAKNEWDAFPAVKQQPATSEWNAFPAVKQAGPEAEGTIGTAAREFAHEAAPAVVGGGLGAWGGAAAGAAVGSVVPGIGTIAGGVIGGLLGGVGGGALASSIQEKGAKLLGFDDDLQRTANRQANPTAATVGGLATAAIPFGWGRGISKLARVGGAAIMGGVETGSELAQGEGLDPTRIALSAGTGAVFAKPRGFIQPLETAGARAGAKLGDRLRPPVDVTQQGGTAGPDAAAGTSQGPKPTTTEPTGDPQNKATLGSTGEREVGGEDLNTRDYGKKIEPTEPGAPGFQVLEPGEADPAINAALQRSLEGRPAEPPAPPEGRLPPQGPTPAPQEPAAPSHQYRADDGRVSRVNENEEKEWLVETKDGDHLWAREGKIRDSDEYTRFPDKNSADSFVNEVMAPTTSEPSKPVAPARPVPDVIAQVREMQARGEPVPPGLANLAERESYRRLGAPGVREAEAEATRATAERQQGMREALAQQGHTPEQIAQMTPDEMYRRVFQQQQQQQQQPMPRPTGGEPPPPSPPSGPPPGAQPPTPPTAGGPGNAQANVLARIAAPKTSLLSRIPTSLAEAKTSLSQFYTAAKNDLHPLEQFTNALRQGRSLAAEEDPNVLARLTRGSSGRVEQMLNHGTFDFETGKNNGASLKEVLQPVADDMNGFTAYAASKRAIELDKRKIDTGIPMPDANTVVAQGAAKYEKTFRDLVAYQDRVLDYLQKSGILSAADVQKMRAKNGEFIPFYRLMDPKGELGSQIGGGLQVRDPIYGIKGSEREILNPIDSVIRNTHTFVSLAERNRAVAAMADLAAGHPEGDKFMQRVRKVQPVSVTAKEINDFIGEHGISRSVADNMTVFRPNAFRPSSDEIRFFRDGKSQVYKVDKPVAEAVNAMDRDSLGMLTKILATPAKLLRAGATLSPEFIARNPVRDQFSALAFSKHGYIPVYDMVRGLGSLLKKDDLYQSWLKSGGANATMVGIDRKAVGLNPKDFISQVQNVIKSPLEALRKASELMENSTRLGEFQRAIEKGASPMEAAFSSREVTLDFARMGTRVKALNAIIPFFNAQIEGVDRAARAFRDNPVGTLAKVGLSITAPSVLLWMANKDDPRYQELPQWQKDLFWIIPTDHWTNMSAADAARIGDAHKRQMPDGTWQRNDGTIYRIPKPFELGVLFGSVPERALEAFYQHNPNAFKNLSGSVSQALLPGFMPQIATPMIEQFANKSTFLDRTMVPQRLQHLPPAEQFTPQTSEVAKTIGNLISKINPSTSFASPIVIDNYIRQYTGGLGNYVVNAMDQALKPSDAPAGPSWTAADTPLLKGFAARFPSAGAQSIQDFYDTFGERKMTKASIDAMKKRDPAAAAERLKTEDYLPGDNFSKQLGKMFGKVRDIYANKQMTPEAKRDAIDTTYLQMIEVAKRGNAFFERTSKKQSVQPAQPRTSARSDPWAAFPAVQ